MTKLMAKVKITGGPAYVRRALDLGALVAKKSHFLLGPRQTGKTTLLRHTLPEARVYDLLDASLYLALCHQPSRLAEELGPKDKVVVIDEIQRLPELLNEVHRLIEERGVRFLLTGSSARKLRRGGVNLLGGRARTTHLHPLTCHELGAQFDLHRALAYGLLPSIYFSDNPRADLQAYTGSYLQQEILAEGVTRNLPAFSRFLRVAALCNGTIVNFTNVANDAQVARTTIYRVFRHPAGHVAVAGTSRLAENPEAQAAGFLEVLLLRCGRGDGTAGPGSAARHAGVRRVVRDVPDA